jgi:hypothetical protein
MKRRWIRAVVIAAWLAAMLWLIRYEAFPGLFSDAIGGYRSLFGKGLLEKDSWMKILFQDTPIGYSHTWVNFSDDSPDRYCTVNNRTVLDLKIMGQRQKVAVNAAATLNNDYRLGRFAFSLSSGGYAMRIEGTRAAGAAFDVRLDTGAHRQNMRITIPDDAVIFSPMTEMAVQRLRPGQSLSLKVFDPVSLATAGVVVTAVRKEPLTLRGRTEETTLLELEYNGLQIRSWVNADNEVLRQETPFGWTMVACEALEALAAESGAGGPEDMLATLAVPCQGTISRPRECMKLRLRLTGGGLSDFKMPSGRQTVESAGEREVVLSVTAPPLPAASGLLGDFPAECEPHLAATPWIQADDPAIVAQARKIVGDHPRQTDAAVAIGEWVYRNVRKNPAVSFPSALDVLQRLEGDCNEHTYLFVALARAAGLPAKVVVGLAYAHGAFYYHAWPAVYVGRWAEMDPTFGQSAVDATHIALLEGELKEQMKLMQFLGTLRAEVLSQEY